MREIEFTGEAGRHFLAANSDIKDSARPILEILSAGFSISWFRILKPMIWSAAVKPQEWIRDRFGLHYEYFLLGNAFDNDFHASTLDEPIPPDILHRVDPQLRFVASNAPQVATICAGWARDRGVSVVVLNQDSIHEASGRNGADGIARLILSAVKVIDRFDNSEPVRTPGEFFGRESLVSECVSRLQNGEPTALMGLRRIGKSSVLRRVQDRLLGATKFINATAFVNCNGSDIKGSHWSHLAARVINEWKEAVSRIAIDKGKRIDLKKVSSLKRLNAGGRGRADPGVVGRALQSDFAVLLNATNRLVDEHSSYVRFAIFLDEADHIGPEVADAGHWKDGYFDFWHTFQALKRGEDPKLISWMLGGVNPSFLEAGAFHDRPNPLFEMSVKYLRPMTQEESGEMLNGIGQLMGLAFSGDAISKIFQFSGGHPWLLRKSGSLFHLNCQDRTGTVRVTASVADVVLKRNVSSFYNHIEWILTHLKQIAPDEYGLLKDLCERGSRAYEEDWSDRDFRDVFARHLEEYGLLRFDEDMPTIAVPLVAEAFQKKFPRGIGEQCRRLREAVDALEAQIRRRLINDLQFPVVHQLADEGAGVPAVCERHREEVIELVVSSIQSKSAGRSRTREELRAIGNEKGLSALFDSLNWEDYVVLIEKLFDDIRISGTIAAKDEFASELRQGIVFFHMVRHNNTSELRSQIQKHGFGICMDRIMKTRGYFAD